ncbi:membrane protein [Streptomyces olivaceoviridis]|uniref:hypothetical protein n=1 Tax=Streptomyces olivaceoviridis TaxID=1921 RepID=UPI0016757000|nr:hypothetical protein [Streptomyces olivaceoviridis]GGY69665.1 membrane protein [Streptomyces olivaceoviridis]
MASDFLTVPAPPPEPDRPAGARPAADATSNATRLLCAGTYLDPVYRAGVIRELLTHRYRVVAPSYGYDAVPVLAHALAARRLQRIRLAVFAAGAALTFVLLVTGALSGFTALLAVLWLLWVTAFLRRVVTLQTLTRRLAPGAGRGFDGSYPEHPELTSQLVDKIKREQTSDGTVVRYGGYKPFVGAGTPVRRWSNAELLIGAPLGVFDGRSGAGPSAAPGAAGQEPKRKEVVPFTVEELTAYVADRMTARLRAQARPAQRIEGLAVERSTFTTAVTTLRGVAEPTPEQLDGDWRDVHDTGRNYLCIRVGSWDQELVTTAFVGFDLKGNTLHTEFYSYVLAPIRASFQLVDRLPAALDERLLLKLAWHTLRGTPHSTVRSAAAKAAGARLLPRLPWTKERIRVPQPADTSEFGLGRYADALLNRGAVTSVREMATSPHFHVFFQETDTIKYTQIVERQFLHVVRDFLYEHNVDLTEHEARQTNILNNYGHNNSFVHGDNNTTNSGTQNFGGPSGGQGAGSA